MLNLIQKIYKKLFSQRSNPKNKNVNQDTSSSKIKKESYIAEMSFALADTEDIDIAYIVPDLDNKSLEELSFLAEKYAKFLMAINEGYLRDDIVKIMTDNTKKSDNPQDHLFWDNVMVYWGMFHVEALKNKRHKEKTDQPLIRPLSVFNRPEN